MESRQFFVFATTPLLNGGKTKSARLPLIANVLFTWDALENH